MDYSFTIPSGTSVGREGHLDMGQGESSFIEAGEHNFPLSFIQHFYCQIFKGRLLCIDLKLQAEVLFTVSAISISKPFPINRLALEADR